MGTVAKQETVRGPAVDLAGRIWRDAGAHASTDPRVWAGLSTLASMRQNRWPGE